jgi:hypothetical protein
LWFVVHRLWFNDKPETTNKKRREARRSEDMPYDDPDPGDPNILVGVVLPGTAEAMEEMAYVFAEEFARMGQGEDAILSLFQDPYYGGAHQAYRALGAEAVRAIVRECVGVWGRAAGRIQEAPEPPGGAIQRLPWPISAATPMPD